MPTRITPGYIALIVLVAWAAILLSTGLIRFGVVGIEEGSAKNLLLLWSLVDRVASPVGTYGSPDLRALLYLPPAIYWPGSVTATKVFTILLTFAAIFILFKWSKKEESDSALIASAVLLICPLTIVQIDTLGAGPYLLLSFALGYWLDIRYREKGRQTNEWLMWVINRI